MVPSWMVCLLLIAGAEAAVTQDVDGDGIVDPVRSVLMDDNGDGSFDPDPRVGRAGQLGDSLLFSKVWDSDTILNNQWDAGCGDLDGDSLVEIIGHHWAPNALHVFESDGIGSYRHVWCQTESLPPGSYGAVALGDPDRDGHTEILGGDVSTLGKVLLFENVAEDSWGDPHLICHVRQRLRSIRVSDTNGNDTAEIILVSGTTDGGKVMIYEHCGAPGVHDYRLIYEYSTVSYVFNGQVGDADNDGYPEVLIGVGGWHGFPMYIRRIVYDTLAGSYSHHVYEHPTVVGLHLTPLVADVDGCGLNELVVGSSGDPCGQLHVFRTVGHDTFEHRWTSDMTSDGNVISATAAPLAGQDKQVTFAAPFSGDVYGFAADDSGFHTVSFFPAGGPVRSIDYCRDRLRRNRLVDRLVLAQSGLEQVTVWQAESAQPVAERARPVLAQQLAVCPTVSTGRFGLTCSVPLRRLELVDVLGRVVIQRRNLPIGHHSFDLHRVSRASSGCFVVRGLTDRGAIEARLLVVY